MTEHDDHPPARRGPAGSAGPGGSPPVPHVPVPGHDDRVGRLPADRSVPPTRRFSGDPAGSGGGPPVPHPEVPMRGHDDRVGRLSADWSVPPTRLPAGDPAGSVGPGGGPPVPHEEVTMSEYDDRLARLSDNQRALLDRWLAEDPAGGAGPLRPDGRPPRTEAERILAGVWEEVLETGGIGADDDYFALGGDSVHAIVIVAKARQAGLALTAHDLFEARTLAAVARRAAPAGPAEPVPDAGGGAVRYPLTPMQQGMLYHSAGGSTPGAYVVQVCCRLTGDLDVAAFRTAWQAVLSANPALAVSFHWSDGSPPEQVVDPDARVTVDTADWRDRTPAERDDAFARFLDTDRAAGFDLARAPLMRLTLFREGEHAYRCVWTHHHLVLDGWSQQLVLRDVLDCYMRLRAGRGAEPPARPSFTGHLRRLERQDGIDEEFWRDHLGGLPAPSRVAGPGCRDGRVVAVRRAEHRHRVSAATGRELTGFCRRHGLTPAAVLHGGWAVLLSLHCGQDDVVFGTTLSGRPEDLPGVTECVGLFINTLPLRVRCGEDTDVVDWLHGVQSDLAALRDHAHVPLSRVERGLGLGRGGGLFDSIMVVENFPAAVADGHEAGGLRVTEPRALVDEGYPLVLEATTGDRPVLHARYDPHRLAGGRVQALLAAFDDYLRAVTADPARPLPDLRAVLARDHARRDGAARGRRRAADRTRLTLARRRPATTTEGETP
ncbi:condensation domain-containing protein [Streptomyces mobaraensis NBRC 13819 = DSM 40847]|uniref:Condensation domain-containing protein n=2 Tax=Streptomyces mobaraensis TaxID=35621 RepID=M3BAD6_STRM1|nr:condensation domain-containing protein [Streptomyces mobaraensis NBRC 13819 = DSM 40847]